MELIVKHYRVKACGLSHWRGRPNYHGNHGLPEYSRAVYNIAVQMELEAGVRIGLDPELRVLFKLYLFSLTLTLTIDVGEERKLSRPATDVFRRSFVG